MKVRTCDRCPYRLIPRHAFLVGCERALLLRLSERHAGFDPAVSALSAQTRFVPERGDSACNRQDRGPTAAGLRRRYPDGGMRLMLEDIAETSMLTVRPTSTGPHPPQTTAAKGAPIRDPA